MMVVVVGTVRGRTALLNSSSSAVSHTVVHQMSVYMASSIQGVERDLSLS